MTGWILTSALIFAAFPYAVSLTIHRFIAWRLRRASEAK